MEEKKSPPITLKVNNYTSDNAYAFLAAEQYKYMIYYESLFGINRLYLVNIPRSMLFITRAYGVIVIATVIYFIAAQDFFNTASYIVFKCTATIELIMLVGSSMLFFQTKSHNFGRKLYKVDEILNITHENYLSHSTLKFIFIWVFVDLFYHVVELIVLKVYIDEFVSATTLVLYIPIIAHDCEQIFFCSLLRSIYLRLQIVRAHVEKFLGSSDLIEHVDREKKEGVLALSNNTALDVTSLHRVYETLHHCSEHLNSMMNLPMVIMLISSGVSTTFMLKSFISFTQSVELPNSNLPVLYYAVRCIKYTLLVFAPCVFCNLTSAHVKSIRTALYDAVSNPQLGRIERRQLKAFLQLTRDSEFAYALWGVIAIDMSLPLSYFSICTTYLVIIIQFSKFID